MSKYERILAALAATAVTFALAGVGPLAAIHAEPLHQLLGLSGTIVVGA